MHFSATHRPASPGARKTILAAPAFRAAQNPPANGLPPLVQAKVRTPTEPGGPATKDAHVAPLPALGSIPSPAATGSGIIQRQVDPRARIEEHVTRAEQDDATDIWEGTMRRELYVPASGTEPRRDLGSMAGVRIRFDPTRCEVVLPTRVRFEHPSDSNWPHCGADQDSPIPDPPLSDEAFRSLADRVLTALNEDLNGWYVLRIANGPQACADRDIPIRVDVSETQTDPDTIVVLANKRGRSCASPQKMTIHAGNATRTRLAHEGLHTVLGVRDEYPPEADDEHRDPASVRVDDLSRASRHEAYAEWGLLHERHFAFVPAFLEHIYPGSTARLRELSRPTGVDFHLSGGLSYANLAGGHGYGIAAGFDIGIPLDRQREWQLLVGAHAQLLFRISDPARIAFLGGLRAGLLSQPSLSQGGLRFGAFVGGGVGSFQPLEGINGPEFSPPRVTVPYGELGGSFGYGWAPSGGSVISINADISAGTTLGIPPTLRGDSREMRFFQAGLRAVWMW